MSGAALRVAATHGEASHLVELLKGGANPCSTDDDGLCALHLAAWNGYSECVDYLLVNDLGRAKAANEGEETADDDASTYVSCVDLQTKAGWTALHIAAIGCFNAEHLVTRLLECGVDPNLRDNSGLTAREIAEDNGNRVVADVLGQNRPDLAHRRATMARLEERLSVVRYRDRPPRPLEKVFDNERLPVQVVGADENNATPVNTIPAGRTWFSALSPSVPEDVSSTSSAAPQVLSGRHAALAFVQDEHHKEKQRRVRVPPVPRELTIPEHLIHAFAEKNCRAGRGAHVLHNLRFAVEEAERNAARRRALASIQAEAGFPGGGRPVPPIP